MEIILYVNTTGVIILSFSRPDALRSEFLEFGPFADRLWCVDPWISQQTMISSQGDSNLCASISVSNVLSYALRRYLLEENVIPGSI